MCRGRRGGGGSKVKMVTTAAQSFVLTLTPRCRKRGTWSKSTHRGCVMNEELREFLKRANSELHN